MSVHPGPVVSGPARSPTLLDVGTDRLSSILRALEYSPPRVREAVATFARFAVPWGDARASATSSWPSDITDDHTPFELSLAVDGAEPETRALVEVQAASPSVSENWVAARGLTRRWAPTYGMDLARLDRVADLFEPRPGTPRFALWHGICFGRARAPDFKVYLNPHARSPERARDLVEEAMRRLGFGSAAPHFPKDARGEDVLYFSLDLSAAPLARVKVYFAHRAGTIDAVEAAVACGPGHAPGRAADFCRAMLRASGPFDRRPILTCLSFVAGDPRPSAVTVHVPVRDYVPNDQAVRDRVCAYLPAEGAAIYRRALDSFARRPLSWGAGMQTYVSLRLPSRRVTVYLATESNRRVAWRTEEP
jgi:DMATS type aromatic prenyltransferase